jgi:autotransporter-associated beta strand protein
VNGTLVLDIDGALLNNTTGAGLTQSLFVLGAITNVISGASGTFTHSAGVLTTTNNSFNAAVYLGDASNLTGGLYVDATVTNNVSDGDVGFTNSGTFIIGGQNTSGINSYYNPIILGWTPNRGKSVTLVARTGGEVDFGGGILANGTNLTAGVTIGNGPTFAGLVNFTGGNSYGGPTIINNGKLELNAANALSNSTPINIGVGTTLDVTGASGFTLGAGGRPQTIMGNGTVNGNLTVLAGSTVAPGASVGTLTVNGNVILGGTLALELNSTNTPFKYDRLVTTGGGTITYGGALTVTNIGPALQAGNSFQLFSSAVSGFTSVNLATSDANNMVYTWQNNVAVNGSITVATAVPLINTNAATANFKAVVAGGSLSFTWAPDHLGWQLYTNAVGLNASGSWFPVPGSAAVTNETIPVNAGNSKVFFQLRYP